MQKQNIKSHIRKRYGEIAKKESQGGCCSGGGCGGGCCCNGAQNDIKESSVSIGYSSDDLAAAPIESNMGLGCGNPIAIAELAAGEHVLDLGCGGGFDCFLARKKVGEEGFVIGVDMTPDMISLAKANLAKSGYTNMDFRLGEIEDMPVESERVDTIISNCVINLSPEKEKVFQEAYRVLKKGGRLCISDVVATAALPDDIKNDLMMFSGCIAGAEHIDKIKQMLINAGFTDVEMYPKDNSKEIISSWTPGRKIEDFVASYIIKAKK